MSISVNGKKIAGVGKPGKSAYQAAVDGGFSGTEEEFNTLLASMSAEPPDASEVGFTSGTTGMSADNVQDAIEELFTSVSDGKSAIAAAVTDMGVQTAATDSYETMAENIKEIETGVQLPTLTNPGTATDLASGKQLIDQEGKIVTGNVQTYESGRVMQQSTSHSPAPTTSNTLCTILPITYDVLLRDGSSVYTEVPLSLFGNATSADVSAGKTFTSSAGVAIQGTGQMMPTMATVSVSIGTVGWTSIDLFTPFDYLSFSSWAIDPSATIVTTPAIFQVPIGGCFAIVAGAEGVKPQYISGGRMIVSEASVGGYCYSMIVVESYSCSITMGLVS